METKNKTPKVIEEKKIKLNENFLNFVKEVKTVSDKNQLQRKYQEIVKLKWSNRSKVIKRANRPELLNLRLEILNKLGVTQTEYQKVLDRLNTTKTKNYVELKTKE